VGPICETGDFLALDREIPYVERGDYLAVLSAGAYGFAMSSHYNARPKACELLVEKGKVKVIRRRETMRIYLMRAFPEPLTFIIPKPSEPQKTFLHPHTGNSLAYRVEFLTMLIKSFCK
jgi:hypothetical protein